MKAIKRLSKLFLLLTVIILNMSILGCKKDVEVLPVKEQVSSDLKAAATGSIISTGTIVNGFYKSGVVLNSTNTVTLKVNVTSIGTYNIFTNTINGYSFSKSGSFTTTGTQNIVLNGSGTPTTNMTNSFTATFGNACIFYVVVVSNLPIVQNGLTYYEVANQKTQKIWLDRNLGSNRVAISYSDYQSYGSLYQWGRLSDDHQKITWLNSYTGTPNNGTSTITWPTNTPTNPLFVKTSTSPWDWRVPQNNSLWQGTTGINNPCPSGFRLPTSSEFQSEITTWTTKNTTGAYGSPLKWVTAGYRDFPDGQVYESGNSGGYWSSTVNSTKSMALWFSVGEAYVVDDFRAAGYSIRCIKN